MEPKVEETLRNYIKDEKLTKVFEKVFDENTILTVHKLATKGLFNVLEYVVSTGKEAHVFRAKDVNGNYRAVKIYKITTSNFKNMNSYLQGDIRFKKIRNEKRDIVFAWTRKEHNNLERANKAGVKVPLPIGFFENVLVMEFIGNDGEACRTLRETGCKDYGKLYKTIVDSIAKLVVGADLIHSDLSEYNILMRNDEPVIIDVGQAVLTSHPKAKGFFDRDIWNVASYFSKAGLKKSYEEVYADVKSAKERLEKREKRDKLPGIDL